MQLLVAAAPRFLAIAVGIFSVYLFFLVRYRPPVRYLVLASLSLSILLAAAAVVGLVAISNHSKSLQRTEFIMQDLVRLGLNILAAYLFYPNTLAPFIVPVNHKRLTLIIWTIIVLMFAGCVFDVTFLFLNDLRIPSFILTALASCLTIALPLRMMLTYLRSPSRVPLIIWPLLAIFQLLALAIAAVHLQVPTGALDVINWFCMLVWSTGTLAVFQSISSVDASLPVSPKLQPLHLPRRIPHVSVSEDFQACRDPFAGPLSHSPFPALYPSHHSLVSLNLKQRNSFYNLSQPLAKTPRKQRPSFQIFSRISSRPTTAGTRQTTATADESEVADPPSFHTAEADFDDHSGDEEEGGGTSSPKKRLTIHTGSSSASHWLLSSAALASLPSLPPPAHLPPSPLLNKHSRTRLRAIDPPLYISPSKSEIDISVTVAPAPPPPLPEVKNRRNISIDRTPTQSLYISNQAHGTQHTATLTSNLETAEDQMLKPPEPFPSIASLPSIPSFMDTPESTFTSDYETSAETRLDDSLVAGSTMEETVLVVEGDIPDEEILQMDKEPDKKQEDTPPTDNESP